MRNKQKKRRMQAKPVLTPQPQTVLNRRQILTGLIGATALAGVGGSLWLANQPTSILDAINQITDSLIESESSLPSGEILFVPMGEIHTTPVSRLVMQGVMQNLKSRNYPIAFGFEGDHDIISSFLKDSIDAQELKGLKELDVQNRGAVTMGLFIEGVITVPEAGESLKNLFSFCIAEKISTRFNDATIISKGFRGVDAVLDIDDPLTRRFVEKIIPDNIVGPRTLSAEGGLIRNSIIVENALKHAREAQARIYIQHCGAIHLAGEKYLGVPFQNSLTGLFDQQGAVFPVDLVGKRFEREISPEFQSLLDDKKASLFERLPSEQFGEGFDESQREKEYIRQLIKGTDLAYYM